MHDAIVDIVFSMSRDTLVAVGAAAFAALSPGAQLHKCTTSFG